MALSDFHQDGWSEAISLPFGNMPVSPAAAALHYGQIVFEGLKAHPTAEGLKLFRPEAHHSRLVESCQRLAMPAPPWETFSAALRLTIANEPATTGVYLRPVVMAWENFLGVRAAALYRFFVIGCPATTYFGSPLHQGGNAAGLRLVTENQWVRAAIGGTGAVKTPGNYAASLAAAENAKKQGYHDVLWLDAKHRRFVEEAGAMNIFFRVDDTLVTPALQGSILNGVTRQSVLRMAQDLGITVAERPIAIEELADHFNQGRFTEAFGTGTAAGVVPIAEIAHAGQSIFRDAGESSEQAKPRWAGLLRERLQKIQTGQIEMSW